MSKGAQSSKKRIEKTKTFNYNFCHLNLSVLFCDFVLSKLSGFADASFCPFGRTVGIQVSEPLLSDSECSHIVPWLICAAWSSTPGTGAPWAPRMQSTPSQDLTKRSATLTKQGWQVSACCQSHLNQPGGIRQFSLLSCKYGIYNLKQVQCLSHKRRRHPT